MTSYILSFLAADAQQRAQQTKHNDCSDITHINSSTIHSAKKKKPKKSHLNPPRPSLLFACLLTLWAQPESLAADVYRWVDSEGITHYGDRPPQGTEAEAINAHYPAPSEAPEISRERYEVLRESQRQADELKAKQIAEQQAEEQQAALRQKNCNRARDYLNRLESRGRVRLRQEDGSYQYLSEQEKQAEIQRARQGINNLCN